MSNKYLDQQGLTTLLNSLASVCAKQSVLTALDNDTTNYLVEIDYGTDIAFDTSEIVKEES